MTAFVPPLAPIVVLAFLGTAFLIAVAGVLVLYAILSKKSAWIRPILTAVATLIGAYGAGLIGASAITPEVVLAPGDLKYFCEIDCHLAYSVAKVETTPELGHSTRMVRASGRFYVIALRAWFDPTTISPKRPLDVPLYPNPRTVYVQDAAGHRYEPSVTAEAALVAMGRASTPLTRPLRPGESYISYLVFDLPNDARNPRLFLGNGTDIEFLLIGHEMSPWHKRVWFGLR